MLARFGFVFAMVLATVFAGCGPEDKVKKNEGTMVNTMPTGGATSGTGAAPAGNPVDPSTKGAAPVPPAMPAINE